MNQNQKEKTTKDLQKDSANVPAKVPEQTAKKSIFVKVQDKVRNVVLTIETNPVGRVIIKGTKTTLYGLGLWKGGELICNAIKPKQHAVVITTNEVEPEPETEDEVETPAEAVEEDNTQEHD